MKLSVKNGLFWGLLLGIIAALLYAPKSGKELRADLKEKIDSVPKNISSLFESIVDLIVSVIDFALDACEEQGSKISQAVSTGVSAAKDKASELKKLATTNSNSK
jgi:gas vesicle protein